MKDGEERFKVKKTTSGNKTVWVVSGYKLNGQRVRKRFDSEREAEGERHLLNVECMEQEAYKPKLTRLTADQLAVAEQSFGLLDDGESLLDAVRWFKKTYTPAQMPMKVPEAVETFITEKGQENIRPATLSNLEWRLRRFARHFKRRKVNELDRDALWPFIMDPAHSPTNQGNNKRVIHNFFEWAVEKKMIAANPTAGRWKIVKDDPDPEILTIDQCKALLRAGRDFKDGKMLGFVVVSLFCGLRPTEAKRLEWEQIDLAGRNITIRGATAKLRQKRHVEIPGNAVPWLTMALKSDGPMGGGNYRRDFASIRKLAGWRPQRPKDNKERALPKWPSDVMRHTALSMRLATTKDEKATSRWAGNSPDILYRHYHGLADEATAAAFWAITPDTVDGDNVSSIAEVAS